MCAATRCTRGCWLWLCVTCLLVGGCPAQIHAKEFAWLMAGDLILVVGGTYFGRQLNDEDDGYQAF